MLLKYAIAQLQYVCCVVHR